MRHGRRDNTHAEVRDELRALGASVVDNGDAGNGEPDLIVGSRRELMRYVEAKSATGKLTPKQVKFHESWRGPPIAIIRSREQARTWYLAEILRLRGAQLSTPAAPPRTGAPPRR
jgi:hypothetical protein